MAHYAAAAAALNELVPYQKEHHASGARVISPYHRDVHISMLPDTKSPSQS